MLGRTVSRMVDASPLRHARRYTADSLVVVSTVIVHKQRGSGRIFDHIVVILLFVFCRLNYHGRPKLTLSTMIRSLELLRPLEAVTSTGGAGSSATASFVSGSIVLKQ